MRLSFVYYLGRMRVGILTGGGDVPGLNVAIKRVVEEGARRGWQIVGIRRGWSGLLHYNRELPAKDNIHWAEELSPEQVRTIDRYGGTHLHSERTNPSAVKSEFLPGWIEPEGEKTDCTPDILRTIEHLGLDALVPIGGDDTLSYALRLHQEGVPTVALPKTMDNDVQGTDYCIGFSTAITRSVDMITSLRTPTGSHERIMFVELFGRNSGETALFSGLLSAADRTVIPEVPFDIYRLAHMLKGDKDKNPSHYAIAVVSEGAHHREGELHESGEADAYGHRKLGGVAKTVAAEVKEIIGQDTHSQELAYLMRSGPPDSLDRMVALQFASMATRNIEQGRSGLMSALSGGRYVSVPLEELAGGVKRVDLDLYDAKEYRPDIRAVEGLPMFLT